jgi:hypothetical protein
MSLFRCFFKPYNDLTSLHTFFPCPFKINPRVILYEHLHQGHYLKKLYLHSFNVFQAY